MSSSEDPSAREKNSAGDVPGKTGGRRAQRQAETRLRLLRAARDVFTRTELSEATIAQITAAADVGFGTFYLYFSTKEDAYKAVIVEGFRELNERIDYLIAHARTNGLNWQETLEQIVQAFLNFAVEQRELFLMMLAGQGAGAEAGFRALWPIGTRITALLQDAQETLRRSAGFASERSVPSAYPLGLLTDLVVTILNRSARWWLRHHAPASGTAHDPADLPTLEEVSAFVCRFIIAGLSETLVL